MLFNATEQQSRACNYTSLVSKRFYWHVHTSTKNERNKRRLKERNGQPVSAEKERLVRGTSCSFVIERFNKISGLPNGDPQVRVEKRRYAVGDTVRGNCTVPSANPPANVTWTVNGVPVG